MPHTIYLPEFCRHSGIDITWTPTSQRLSIGGWYDSCVGIENTALTLREFFDKLGITESDCKRAFKATVVKHRAEREQAKAWRAFQAAQSRYDIDIYRCPTNGLYECVISDLGESARHQSDTREAAMIAAAEAALGKDWDKEDA